MEKAIDIKRRAQRCLQSGDLDGALSEYEKLTRAEDSEPINLVLMADLLYKKGDLPEASRRYLEAVDAYTGAGLYKNAIAVCKKMARLSLSLAVVLQRLAELHLLDGLTTEAALYFQEYAEHQAREGQFRGAAGSLRKAFDASPENPRLLEKAAEWLLRADDATAASALLIEASRHFARLGQPDDATRAQERAEELASGAGTAHEAPTAAAPAAAAPPAVQPAAAPAAAAPTALAVEPTAGPDPEAAPAALAVQSLAGLEPEVAPPPLIVEPAAWPRPEVAPPALIVQPPAGLEPEVAPPALIVQPPAGLEPEVAPPTVIVQPPAGLEPEVAPPALTEQPPAGPAPEAVLTPAGDAVDGLEQQPTFEHPPADEAPSDLTPPTPAGLRFEPAPAPQAISAPPELPDVDDLLRLAAERLRKGDHDLAADALIEAARAYESLDRLESAAAIYRSLGRSTHATPEVLGLWLRNCEQRDGAREAAEVACGLGDLALNDGDLEGAREWFVRALKHVPGHELATRRLQRMGTGAAEPVPAEDRSPGEITEPSGRVEVAVGRAQAVTLDLGSVIAEFQRGIKAQLSGDAQSHYDLGMTYREMGLLEQAVECFRTAARDPAFALRSAEMVGRSLLDQGCFDDAAEEFTRALEGLGESSEEGACLRFQLGLAHEVAGRAAEALAEFERVYAVQPNYPDVAQKIRVLRRTLERV